MNIYYKLKDDKPNQKILIDIFNSKLGHINKIRHNLNTLILLTDTNKLSKKIFIDSINRLSEELDQYKNYNHKLDNLDNLTFDEIKDRLQSTVDDMLVQLESDTDDYIKKHNLSHILL